jgi:hypothetical protein
MKKYGLLISVFIVAAVYSTPAQQGCGPNPLPMANAAQQNYSMQQSQAQQQARQIQQIEAQFNFTQAQARLQHQYRLDSIRNQGNPQASQVAAQTFQSALRALQEGFQLQMRQIQGQP